VFRSRGESFLLEHSIEISSLLIRSGLAQADPIGTQDGVVLGLCIAWQGSQVLFDLKWSGPYYLATCGLLGI
jgi:hypothetical protein